RTDADPAARDLHGARVRPARGAEPLDRHGGRGVRGAGRRARGVAAMTTTASGLEVEIQGRFGALAMDVALRAAAAPVVVAGPNGAGKTTLLMAILGAQAPEQGRVVLDGVGLYDRARGIDVPIERRRIGYLPQRYALFPHLTVLDNVAYGVLGASRT